MKIKTILALSLLTCGAQAATSFSGTGITAVKNSLGTANVASGSLAMLIVDIDGDGFLGMGAVTPGSLLTTTNDPDVTPSSAGLTLGSLFGGDRVASITQTGGTGIGNLLPSQDITAFLGKAFAVIWFDGILTSGAPATAPSGAKYGIARGNDWTFPIADVGGALTFNNSDSGGANTLWQVNSTTGVGASVAGFMTTAGGSVPNAASFVVVPEPSAALLGAVGALGLLRRRRN